MAKGTVPSKGPCALGKEARENTVVGVANVGCCNSGKKPCIA